MRYRHISFHQARVLTRLLQSTGCLTTICSDRVRTHFKHPKTRTPPVGFLFPLTGRSCASSTVPEEGVSRLITQQSSERRDHYTRYGLAFLLEHGFMVRIAARLSLRRHSTDARTPFAAHAQGPHVLPDEPRSNPQRHSRDGVHRRH